MPKGQGFDTTRKMKEQTPGDVVKTVAASIVAIFAALAWVVVRMFQVEKIDSVRPMHSVLVSAALSAMLLGIPYGLVYSALPMQRTLLRSVLFAAVAIGIWMLIFRATNPAVIVESLINIVVIGVAVHLLTRLMDTQRQ
jgi:hypothetical protein